MTSSTPTVEAVEVQKIETSRQVCLIRFNADGTQIFGGGYDAVIRRWQLSTDTAQPLEDMVGHRGWVQMLEFLPDEPTLVSVDSWGQLRAWDVSDPDAVKVRWKLEEAHDGWIHALAVSRDGSLIATAGRDRYVRLWSADTGDLVRELPQHTQEPYRLVIHPDNKTIISADKFGMLREWSLTDGTCQRELHLEKMHFYDRIQDVPGIYVLQFDETAEHLWCTGGQPTGITNHLGIPVINQIRMDTFETVSVRTFGTASDGFIFDFIQHPSGYQIAVTSGTPGNGQVLMIAPDGEEPFFKHSKLSNCHSVILHPNGQQIVVSATNRNSQGNGAVRDSEGAYVGNSSPLHVFQLSEAAPIAD